MVTLLERAQREGTPLIDGDQATFVWHGEGEVPQLVGDFTGWSAQPITLTQAEPEVWTHTITLPPDAYVTYQFSLRYDITETFADRFNPRIVFNGIDAVNHYFTMPQYRAPDLIQRKPGVQRGAISEHWLETGEFIADSHRKIYLYHPPVDEATPLLVVWDGWDYLHRGALNVIVDNLIAEGRIRPLAMAFVSSTPAARFMEYMQNEVSVSLLTQLILPFSGQHLNLISADDERGVHGILGSSMGGLMALYTGLRAADVFGHVVCQSGAFWMDDPRRDMLSVDFVKTSPGGAAENLAGRGQVGISAGRQPQDERAAAGEGLRRDLPRVQRWA